MAASIRIRSVVLAYNIKNDLLLEILDQQTNYAHYAGFSIAHIFDFYTDKSATVRFGNMKIFARLA